MGPPRTRASAKSSLSKTEILVGDLQRHAQFVIGGRAGGAKEMIAGRRQRALV
jgi:hypothetical protein